MISLHLLLSMQTKTPRAAAVEVGRFRDLTICGMHKPEMQTPVVQHAEMGTSGEGFATCGVSHSIPNILRHFESVYFFLNKCLSEHLHQ